MSCEVCDIRASGDPDRAASMEAFRHRRLLLAVFNGATDAVAETRNEMGDCVPCLLALAGSFLAINAGMPVVSFGGDQKAAAHAVQQVLLDYIDEQGKPR